jgi:pyruvate ferredoxin oxidoreductase delta subunit
MKKPYLRAKSAFSIDEYPDCTSFTAGYLTTPNGGWRSSRPRLDASKCVMCGQCYLHCPDGTIYLDGETGGYVVDLDFCKGCGICAKICKPQAISMIPEGTA